MQLQGAYGDQINEQLLRQLGISQQVIQQLIDEQAILAEADRLGVEVNDGELKARILRVPGFLENGQFIGDARYRQLLASQRPPMRAADFESQLRQALVSEKLQAEAEQARVADYASAELTLAREKLSAARIAVQNEDMLQAEYLADESQVYAELASARAEEAKAKAINDDMQKSIDTLKHEMQRVTGATQ